MLVAALAMTPQAIANVAAGSEDLVGENFRISDRQATGAEYDAAIAHNTTDGQFLVVWEDDRDHTDRGFDIYGRRIGVDGVLGASFRISGRAATGDDWHSDVAYNSVRNEYLVVWHDERAMPTRSGDIYAQRIAADGTKLGSNFRLSGKSATGDDRFPSVVFNPSRNQYLVVWSDERKPTTRGGDIYGQRLRGNGATVGNNFRISGTSATQWETWPEVAFNSATRQYLVVWQDERKLDSRDLDIFGQRLRADGATIGNNFRISGKNATDADSHPHVVYNSVEDQYFVVWQDRRNYNQRQGDIFGQRISATGELQGTNARVAGTDAADAYPDIGYDATNNRYLVVWAQTRHRDTRGADISGRRLAADGDPLGSGFRISGRQAIGFEDYPALTFIPSRNRFLVVWEDGRKNLERGFDIYGQRVGG